MKNSYTLSVKNQIFFFIFEGLVMFWCLISKYEYLFKLLENYKI